MKLRKGSQDATGLTVGIVASKVNKFVTSRLLTECVKALTKAGASDEAIEVVRVPGAFEIPLVARQLARSGRFDAVICLGAVIRGSTSHYDYVCNEVSKGVAQVGMSTGVPTIFGVVTTENIEQAIERAGTKAGNKGADGAMAAMEMANLLKNIG